MIDGACVLPVGWKRILPDRHRRWCSPRRIAGHSISFRWTVFKPTPSTVDRILEVRGESRLLPGPLERGTHPRSRTSGIDAWRRTDTRRSEVPGGGLAPSTRRHAKVHRSRSTWPVWRRSLDAGHGHPRRPSSRGQSVSRRPRAMQRSFPGAVRIEVVDGDLCSGTMRRIVHRVRIRRHRKRRRSHRLGWTGNRASLDHTRSMLTLGEDWHPRARIRKLGRPRSRMRSVPPQPRCPRR